MDYTKLYLLIVTCIARSWANVGLSGNTASGPDFILLHSVENLIGQATNKVSADIGQARQVKTASLQ